MIKEITDKEFKLLVIKSDKPILVDFWAPWCGPCKTLMPIIDEISKEYEKKVLVIKLNIDNNSKLSSLYNIQSVPTLIFFKDGKEKNRKIGISSKEDIKKNLDKLLK